MYALKPKKHKVDKTRKIITNLVNIYTGKKSVKTE